MSSKTYNPKTSEGAFAIEFGTTSVSSNNSDERYPIEQVKTMETELLKINPHIKYVNQRDHGYLLLKLFPDHVVSEWYYMETVRQPQTNEFPGKKAEVSRGAVQLKY